MNYNGRNNTNRRKYSDRHYKKLVIEDKQEVETNRASNKERIDAARDKIEHEAGYVDGYRKYIKSKHGKQKRAKVINMGKKAMIAIVLTGTMVLGSIAIFPTRVKAEITSGYEVVLNGTVLGVTESIEPVANALVDIRREFREDYDMNVFDKTVLEYNPVKIDQQYICPPDLFVKILKGCVDVKVVAWVISVNNAPAAAVKTQAEAQAALDRVLEPFLDVPTTRNRVDVGFVENVEVVEMAIEYSQVGDEESAYRLLRFGEDIEEKRHVVVSGESLYSISKSYGVKIADLRKANPYVASTDKIYPGDVLLTIAPLNRVNVKFVEEVDKIGQPIPFETEKIKDDSMLETERVVIQEGIEGSHDVHALITFINGVETEVHVISEANRRDPINAVIKVGTKPVPRLLALAVSDGMDIPLKTGTYRISSKFGPRTIDVVGASSWHKGVDLAANTGTPIYASEAGVITKSGSGTGYGLYIKIDHGNGLETRYGHCSELLVSKGDRVKKGQLIALVGNTGISGGSHLHFEVRINGLAYDPLGEYEGPAPS